MDLRCLIVDDEPLAVKLLADYVDKAPGLALSASFTDPLRALQYLRENTVEVLFLDVQMPELNGLEVARLVGNRCRVVLTTAYDDYALAGYDLNVVDYLLKPISFGRFLRAADKLLATAPGAPAAEAAPASPAPAPAPAGPESIFVKVGHRTHRIDLRELHYGSANGDYLNLYLADGRKLLTLENIGTLLARLPADRFCRIHRSHFVALARIDFVERRRVVIGGEYLPISDSYQEEFYRRIG